MFLSLATLLYSLELWRGKRAYASLQREVEAKGGSLAFSAVIPPPVPDAQNFCATPLLAAITDYESRSPLISPNTEQWRNPAIIDRLRSMSLPTPGRRELNLWVRRLNHPGEGPSHPRPKQGQQLWLCAGMTDLAAWQEAFTEDTSYPVSSASRGPAEAVLLALSKFDAELNELHAANQRPAARWALHYQDGWFVQTDNTVRWDALRNLVGILKLRAAAELASDRTDAALQDVKLSLRLANSLQSEPLFFSHDERQRLLLTSLQAVWEGLVTHRWTESQLPELQSRLSQFDLSSDWRKAMRGETYLRRELFRQMNELLSLRTIRTLFANSQPERWVLSLMWLFYPTGWYYQDQVYLYRLGEQRMMAGPWLANPNTPSAAKEVHLEMPEDPLLAIFILPGLREIFGDTNSFTLVQTSLEQARLACALERYRLANGEYPATLEALTPRFIDTLPSPAITRQPLLEYRRTTSGQFLLYPAGMTHVSESWHPSVSQENAVLLGRPRGDIDGVWRFPAN